MVKEADISQRDFRAADVMGILEVPALLMFLWLVGCTTSAGLESRSSGAALLGINKHDLLSCAGQPLSEITIGDGRVLRYYKEAPMLEESFVGSKGSKPGIHGGCWANIMLSDDYVTGVEYNPVPDPLKSTDQCEEIFRSCVQ